MTKNVYFHDNVMFILKMSPGLIVSVLVYSFSLRSLVWPTVSAVSQRLRLELTRQSSRGYT